jgi:hypothetical protein
LAPPLLLFFFLRGGLLCPLALLLIDLAVTLLGLLAGLVPAGVQCGLGVPASTEPRLEAPLPAGPSAYSSPLFSTALAFIRHLPAGLGGVLPIRKGPLLPDGTGRKPCSGACNRLPGPCPPRLGRLSNGPGAPPGLCCLCFPSPGCAGASPPLPPAPPLTDSLPSGRGRKAGAASAVGGACRPGRLRRNCPCC